MASSAVYWARMRFSIPLRRSVRVSWFFWFLCNCWLKPSVRVAKAPPPASMLSVTTRKRLAKPSRVGSVRLEFENDFLSSGRLASALSSRVALTVIDPSPCNCKPASDRWAKAVDAPDVAPTRLRSCICRPTTAPSPCKSPPFLPTGSYLVSVEIIFTTAL